MRRVFILGLLFALMYALQFLQVEAETAFNAKSLATVGFILLAAYTLGEITGRFGLPKITGYIVTGLLFGPYVVNLFSVEVVNDLKIINGLAIGLIALSAGGEMKVTSLKQIARSLTLIVTIKGTLTLVMVIAAVYAVAMLAPPWLPFLADAPTPLILAVGGLFGVLAIGTSPAATIAVINETGARGRLADTTLGVAVFKDVVMVVLLAIFIALAKVFSTPDAVFDAHVLVVVGEELLFSILAGALLGGVIIAYLRFLGAEMWLFVIAVIFAMTTLAQLFHLEALLLFITAGFVVQNFSKHGDDFVHLIESVALPVYVVFFSVAGAGLDLNALVQVGLVAGVLVVVRLAAIFAGTRLATRLAGEPAPLQKYAWLAFVSQAGVVLGLTIIIETNLPGLGPGIRTVVLGTIAINLLAGPVLFKMALAKVGETPSEDAAAPPDEASPEADAEAPEVPLPPGEVRYPEPAFASPNLTAAALHLQERLVRLQQDFQDQFLDRETRTHAQFLGHVRAHYTATMDALRPALAAAAGDPRRQAEHLRESRMTFSRWLQSEAAAYGTQPGRTEAARQTFADFIRAVHACCLETEVTFVVLQEQARFEAHPADTAYVRFRKALKRLGEQVSATFGSGVRGTRTVPFRRIAHYHLDGLLPGLLVPLANLTGALPLYVLDKTRILNQQIDAQITAALQHTQPSDDPDAPDAPALDADALAQMAEETEADFAQALADVQRYGDELQQHLAFALVQRYTALLHDLDEAGTFALPARRRRFSLVYERSQQAQQTIQQALGLWQDYVQGGAGSLVRQLDVVVLADQVDRIVDDTVVQVSTAIQDKVGRHVETAHAACTATLETLTPLFASPEAAASLPDTLATQQHALLHVLDAEMLAPLTELRESRLLHTLLDRMLEQFSELALAVPETYQVIEPEEWPPAPTRSTTPPEARMKVAPMRQVTRTYLETRLARNLAEANQTLFREVDVVIQALSEVRHLVRFNLQAALDELDAGTDGSLARAEELALDGLRRTQRRLDRTREQITQFAAEAETQIHDSTAQLIERLETQIKGQTALSLRLQREQQKALSRTVTSLQATGQRLRERLRRALRQIQRRFRPLADDLVRDYRSGLSLNALEPAEALHRYDQATLHAREVERLPFIYQKLFAFAPLEADEFLVGRADERKTFALARQRWAGRAPTPVAVVGEPGVGTSSFVRALLRAAPEDAPTYHVPFTQTPSSEEALVRLLSRRLQRTRANTFADLTRQLRSDRGTRDGRLVVVLEDVHHLYRRAPGGFDLLRQLLQLITTTSDQVLWVASMNSHAWHYLDAVLQVSDAFAFTLTLPPLTRAEMEEALLVRHRFSGLDLHFLPSPLMRQRRRYQRAAAEEQQAMIQAAFFDQLYRLSGGNPLAAQFYWLKAIDAVDDRQLTLRPLERQPFGYLRSLDLTAQLTLKVLLQQGLLTVDEHAHLFGLTAADSHATLMHLTQLNLVTRHDRTTPVTFRLHGPIYKPLARELAALNLLA